MEGLCCYLGIGLIYLGISGFLVSNRAGFVKALLELFELDFYEGLRKLIAFQNIVSMSGGSSTGNNTLTLQLIGRHLKYEQLFEESNI